MIRLVYPKLLVILFGLGCAGSVAAEQSSLVLSHNPFSRPAMLAAPAVKSISKKGPLETTPLPELTATLVSGSMPMVIVNGELLEVDEEVDGYRLVAVDEGRAVFIKRGERHTLLLVGSGVEVK